MVLAIALIVVVGCQKERLTQNSSNTNQLTNAREGGGKDCFEGVKVVCDHILAFTDMQQFQDVYDCLDQAYETWNDDFESAHSSLSDDDYNDYCDSVGFEDDQPLIDFESSLNFYSYRKYMNGLEDTWLANGADSASDPDNNDVLDDDILATMFSYDQAVMINDTIYWIDKKTGNIYGVTNSDCNLLAQLQANPAGVAANNGAATANSSKVIMFPTTNGSECNQWGGKSNWHPYSSDKKYKWTASFKFLPWSSTNIKGKIKSYKKKNGHWKKYRTGVEVHITGIYYDYQCSQNSTYDKDKAKRRKKLKAKIINWGEKDQYKSGDPNYYFRANSAYNIETL
ncbi:MAG: hypothetical protein JSS90_12210 [Bacteroidetes bacterium]|nr:hypothetical protein [Bacteroidota bacterium]